MGGLCSEKMCEGRPAPRCSFWSLVVTLTGSIELKRLPLFSGHTQELWFSGCVCSSGARAFVVDNLILQEFYPAEMIGHPWSAQLLNTDKTFSSKNLKCSSHLLF